jgi:hypothetical protein
VGRLGDRPAEASFSDLVGYLDFTAAGYFEGRNPKMVLIGAIWGLVGRTSPGSGTPSSVTNSPNGSRWVRDTGF